MNRAQALLILSAPTIAVVLLGGVWSSAQPTTGATATRPAGPSASNPAFQPSSLATTQPIDEKGVAELIRLLGDDSFKVREEATHKLIAMGPTIGRLIEAKLQDNTLDLERAVRIKAVLDQIDRLSFGWPFDANEAARRQDETCKALGIPKELALDLGNNVSLKLVLIPAGSFMMGSSKEEQAAAKEQDRMVGHPDADFNSEGPQHEVKISKPFYVGIYTVTQEQYELVTGKDPSNFKGAQNPVERVTWGEAAEFCKKLSQKTGRAAGLPTEAQWEYACRAGSKTRFFYGDDEDYGKLGDYAWYSDNSNGKTHAVSQKKPNAWGLYDMHGNLWQWCSDWYADSYAGAEKTDPAGPASGSLRVKRGGGWNDLRTRCRGSYRYGYPPDNRGTDTGIRVLVDAKQPGAAVSAPARRVATTPTETTLVFR